MAVRGTIGVWRYVTSRVMSVATTRFTDAGDEAGTAPEDRPFRPDVQGLRAVAILLVVLYHAGIPGISGGYVGVDVFFVISGFVITGVLLRERVATRRTSIVAFYGRRARRIIPAASLVIIVTVVAAFHYLGTLTGHETAVDGQWAALFLANFHFAASQTNYLASQQPPSALQNFWSLAVEEQFYIVYPTIFLVTARLARGISLRARLTVVLVTVIVISYAYSVVLTSTNAPSAFFSPLTRAWELALGGLIAVAGQPLRRVPQSWAALMSWLGLAAIVVTSLTLTATTAYPGALVAFPVLGAGLVIAGGSAQPAWGVERLLGQRPFQLLGLISYSLYLWHWPILIIATQSRGTTTLPVWDNVMWLLVATAVATGTYWFLENPVRHSKFLIGRRWASIVLGLCLIGATLGVTTYERQRLTVDLGALASARPGSICNSPSSSDVAKVRSTYLSGHPRRVDQADVHDHSVLLVGDSTSCSLLVGLEAVGSSYGMQIENGAVIGCGVVSGTLGPYFFPNGVNFLAYSDQCQGEANRAETLAIERYHPSLVVWGSTYEHSSILVGTGHKSRVLVPGTPKWRSVMLGRMDTRVERFLATGARVILLLEPPPAHTPDLAPPSAQNRQQMDSQDVDYEQMNDLLREVAERHPHQVAVVNLEARVCPSGPPCPFTVTGFDSRPASVWQAVRPDGMHYVTNRSSLWVAEWLVPEIAAASRGIS